MASAASLALLLRQVYVALALYRVLLNTALANGASGGGPQSTTTMQSNAIRACSQDNNLFTPARIPVNKVFSRFFCTLQLFVSFRCRYGWVFSNSGGANISEMKMFQSNPSRSIQHWCGFWQHPKIGENKKWKFSFFRRK